MRAGDRVRALDPTDEENEELVEATYLRLVALLGISGRMSHELGRIQYDDRREENWPDALVLPIDAPH